MAWSLTWTDITSINSNNEFTNNDILTAELVNPIYNNVGWLKRKVDSIEADVLIHDGKITTIENTLDKTSTNIRSYVQNNGVNLLLESINSNGDYSSSISVTPYGINIIKGVSGSTTTYELLSSLASIPTINAGLNNRYTKAEVDTLLNAKADVTALTGENIRANRWISSGTSFETTVAGIYVVNVRVEITRGSSTDYSPYDVTLSINTQDFSKNTKAFQTCTFTTSLGTYEVEIELFSNYVTEGESAIVGVTARITSSTYSATASASMTGAYLVAKV